MSAKCLSAGRIKLNRRHDSKQQNVSCFILKVNCFKFKYHMVATIYNDGVGDNMQHGIFQVGDGFRASFLMCRLSLCYVFHVKVCT